MAEFNTIDISSLPLQQILVRGKTGLQGYTGPNSGNAIMENGVYSGITNLRSSPVYSNDGQILAIIYETKNLTLYNTSNGDILTEIPFSDIQKVEFSPKGTFLVTWSRPTKGSASDEADGNLRVWHVQSGVMTAAYSLKTYKADSIQWTVDEAYCFRLVTNEVHIFDGSNLNGGILEKVRHKGLISFKVTPTSVPYVSIAVFNPDAGGKPARVSLYQFKGAGHAVEGPLNSRTIFAASEAKFLWNSTGTSLLVHSHSDVDSSNTSYYGATGLYILLAGNSDVSNKVEQSKEGPIHDVQWSPNGDRLAIDLRGAFFSVERAFVQICCRCRSHAVAQYPLQRFWGARVPVWSRAPQHHRVVSARSVHVPGRIRQPRRGNGLLRLSAS